MLVAALVGVGVVGLAVGTALSRVVDGVRLHVPTTPPARVLSPLLALLTATLFVLVTRRLAELGQGAVTPAVLTFLAVGIALSAVDLAEHRLPDVLVLPCYPVLAALLTMAALLTGDRPALLRALLGGVVLGTCYLALALASPRSMGMGDVKLAGVVGLLLGWFSWSTLLAGGVAAFVLGAVVGLGLIAAGRAGRRTAVPFGPFMVAGALLSLWVTDPVAALLTGG